MRSTTRRLMNARSHRMGIGRDEDIRAIYLAASPSFFFRSAPLQPHDEARGLVLISNPTTPPPIPNKIHSSNLVPTNKSDEERGKGTTESAAMGNASSMLTQYDIEEVQEHCNYLCKQTAFVRSLPLDLDSSFPSRPVWFDSVIDCCLVSVSQQEIVSLYERFCQLDRSAKGFISEDEFLSIPEFSLNPLSKVRSYFFSRLPRWGGDPVALVRIGFVFLFPF